MITSECTYNGQWRLAANSSPAKGRQASHGGDSYHGTDCLLTHSVCSATTSTSHHVEKHPEPTLHPRFHTAEEKVVLLIRSVTITRRSLKESWMKGVAPTKSVMLLTCLPCHSASFHMILKLHPLHLAPIPGFPRQVVSGARWSRGMEEEGTSIFC